MWLVPPVFKTWSLVLRMELSPLFAVLEVACLILGERQLVYRTRPIPNYVPVSNKLPLNYPFPTLSTLSASSPWVDSLIHAPHPSLL